LTRVQISKPPGAAQTAAWPDALAAIGALLAKARPGTTAIIASARQTNEELYLLKKLAARLGALTDSVPRMAEGDKLLLNADRNPNSTGARLIGISAQPAGSNLPKIAAGIAAETIKTLIVFGEDVTKAGLGENLLSKLDTLIVSDILPNKTTALAHYLLPGCAHAEKRGSFVNVHGRAQRFMQNIQPKGGARAEWEFLLELARHVAGVDGISSIEGLFNQMAADVPAFRGLTWAALGDLGATVAS